MRPRRPENAANHELPTARVLSGLGSIARGGAALEIAIADLPDRADGGPLFSPGTGLGSTARGGRRPWKTPQIMSSRPSRRRWSTLQPRDGAGVDSQGRPPPLENAANHERPDRADGGPLFSPGTGLWVDSQGRPPPLENAANHELPTAPTVVHSSSPDLSQGAAPPRRSAQIGREGVGAGKTPSQGRNKALCAVRPRYSQSPDAAVPVNRGFMISISAAMCLVNVRKPTFAGRSWPVNSSCARITSGRSARGRTRRESSATSSPESLSPLNGSAPQGLTCGTARRSQLPANRRPCRRAVPGRRHASSPS